MDGNTSPKSECEIFDRGHVMQLNQQQSGPSKTVYTCPCGHSEDEYEDAGTGA